MKLNNKGFAITAVLYGLLILFVVLVSSYLTVLSARKNRTDTLIEEIKNGYIEKQNSISGEYVVIVKVTDTNKVALDNATINGTENNKAEFIAKDNTVTVDEIDLHAQYLFVRIECEDPNIDTDIENIEELKNTIKMSNITISNIGQNTTCYVIFDPNTR